MKFPSNNTYVLSTLTLIFGLLTLVVAQAGEEIYTLSPGEVVVPVAHGPVSSQLYKRDWLSDLWNSWFPPTQAVATTSSIKPSTTVKPSSTSAAAAKTTSSSAKAVTNSVKSSTSTPKTSTALPSTTSIKSSSTVKAAIVSESVSIFGLPLLSKHIVDFQ